MDFNWSGRSVARYQSIYRHGGPKRILSDQGLEFIARVNLLLSGRLKVDRVFIAARSPSGNGRAERFAST